MKPPRKKPTAVAMGKQPGKPRRSKLAQEHDLTTEEESEIRAAWDMFAIHNNPDYEEKEGVVRREDVRRALK